jgi:hypothetical protein
VSREYLAESTRSFRLRREHRSGANAIHEVTQPIVQLAHEEQFRQNSRGLADCEPCQRILAKRLSVSQMTKKGSAAIRHRAHTFFIPLMYRA